MDSRDSLVSSGYTRTICAAGEIPLNGIYPACEALIISLFGRDAAGPLVNFVIFCRCAAWSCFKKCVDAPLSALAMQVD